MLLPRYLGDERLGQYSVAIAIAGLAGTLASLGVPNYLVRRVAAEPWDALRAGSAAVVLLAGSAFLVSAGLLISSVWLGIPSSDHALLGLALGCMVVTTLQRVIASVLNGQEQHARFAWLNAAAAIGGTLGGVAMLMLGGNADGYLAASLVASAAILVLAWYMAGLQLRGSTFHVRLWRQLAGRSLPFLTWNVALEVRNQIDVLLVAALLSQQAAGWLAAAYRIVFLPRFLPVIVTTPLLPVLTRSANDRSVFDKTLRRSLLSVIIVTVPACAMIMALGPDVPGLLGWGPAFDRSVPLMMVLAFDQPLAAVDMVLGTALFALKREKTWLRVALLAAGFNPLMNLVAIPLFEGWVQNGALGAAVVEIATELLMLAGAVRLLPPDTIGRRTAGLAARISLAGVCVYVVATALRPVSLPFAATCGSLTFVVAALVLRVFTATDIRSLRSMSIELIGRRCLLHANS